MSERTDAAALGLAARVESLLRGDFGQLEVSLGEAAETGFDVVVSNPPYLASGEPSGSNGVFTADHRGGVLTEARPNPYAC